MKYLWNLYLDLDLLSKMSPLYASIKKIVPKFLIMITQPLPEMNDFWYVKDTLDEFNE